jgi:hypothetical protein
MRTLRADSTQRVTSGLLDPTQRSSERKCWMTASSPKRILVAFIGSEHLQPGRRLWHSQMVRFPD